MNLIGYGTDAINETVKFTAYPPDKPSHEISLKENKEVENGGEITTWALRRAAEGLQLLLRKQDGSLKVVMKLNSQGHWRGRDIETKGLFAMKPEGSPNVWRDLADPGRFMKKKLDELRVEAADHLPDVVYKEANAVPKNLDWESVAYNLADDYDPAIQSDTAIAIIACDRLSYFKEVLEGLCKNPEVREKKHPVYIFIDRPLIGNTHVMVEHEELAKKLIPHAHCIHRPINLGCGRNIIDARHQLLTNMDYKYAYIFEDDMVPSPEYLTYCRNLMLWGEKNYDNVGVVQGWSKCLLGSEEKKEQLSTVHASRTNLWGYLISRKCWEGMSPTILEYQRLFLKSFYHDRPNKTIRPWFREVLKKCAKDSTKPFPVNKEYKDKLAKYWDSPATGQDAATLCSMQRAGFLLLAPNVNRGLYIGRRGIHQSPAMFEQMGYGKMSIEDNKMDARRRNFHPDGEAKPTKKKPKAKKSPVKGLAVTDTIDDGKEEPLPKNGKPSKRSNKRNNSKQGSDAGKAGDLPGVPSGTAKG